jgi:signal peptidase I
MSPLIRWFSQLYSVMLYAYPRQFRLEYGDEMQRAFRDRCGYLLRTKGTARMLRFATHSGFDWLTTAFRETADVLLSPPELAPAPVETGWLARLRSVAHDIWTNGRKPSPRGFIAEWAMTIVIYLFATSTMVQAFVVPTGSMESNLRIGDHMLVDRMVYADPGPLGGRVLPYRDVERGDIVAFLYPEDIRQTYVKRVIGLPGDHIRMVKQVIRNGHRLLEPYTQHIVPGRDPYRDDFPSEPDYSVTPRGREMLANHVRDGELVVPPGVLFMMGDNRENSADSRYWGFVPRSYVVGKPLVVYWSYDAPTNDLMDWSLAHVVDVTLHFFTKTRWDRMFLAPRSQPAKELPFEPGLSAAHEQATLAGGVQ